MPALQTLLNTGERIVWAVMIGAVCLLSAVGLFGFARSKRMGLFVLASAILVAIVFIINVRALVRIT